MKAFVWFNWKGGGDYPSPVPGVPMRWLKERDVVVHVVEPVNPLAWMDEELGI